MISGLFDPVLLQARNCVRTWKWKPMNLVSETGRSRVNLAKTPKVTELDLLVLKLEVAKFSKDTDSALGGEGSFIPEKIS